MAHKLTTSLSLDMADDADIIEWLEQQDNKSRAIRDAIRAFIQRNSDITLGDVYRAVEELKHKIERGVIMVESCAPQAFEPEDAVRALDDLAKM